MKLLILGGAGMIASFSLEKLLADASFDEIVIADYDEDAAKEVAEGIGITAQTARKHLKILADKNLLKSIYLKKEIKYM